MMIEERRQLIEEFANGYDELKSALGAVPGEMWHYRPAPGKWSVHEIVVHMADSEVNGYIRCRTLLAEPGKTIMAYDQDRWAAELDYEAQSADDALELFGLLRRSTTRLLETMPASAWELTIHHPERGMMTLDDWLATYAGHVRTHVRQIERTREEWVKGRG